MTEPGLADKLVAVHRSLDTAAVPHAFGGALALAYCTAEPRATMDLDVNVFVPPTEVDVVASGLDAVVALDEAARTAVLRSAATRPRSPASMRCSARGEHGEAKGAASADPPPPDLGPTGRRVLAPRNLSRQNDVLLPATSEAGGRGVRPSAAG